MNRHLLANNKILYRFWMSYLLVLILPVIMGILIYNKTITMVEKDIRVSNLGFLEQSKDIIDKHLHDVDTLAKQLMLNSKINEFLYMSQLEEGSPEIFKVIEASRDLSFITTSNSFIKEFYIFHRKIDMILSSKTSCTRENLYSNTFSAYTMDNYSQWYYKLMENIHEKEFLATGTVKLQDKNIPVIPYLQTMPFGCTTSNIKGAIMVLIDETMLKKLLSQINIGDSGWVYIEDRKGRIVTGISSSGNKITTTKVNTDKTKGMFNSNIQNQEMAISYTISSINGWKYVAVLPSSFILQKAEYIKRTTFIITLAFLLVGLIVSYLLAYRNAKPVKALQERIMEQKPFMQVYFLRRLLDGNFTDETELKKIQSNTDFKANGRRFAVIILKINGYGNATSKDIFVELNALKVLIMESTGRILAYEMPFYEIDENKICMLVSLPYSDVTECIEYLKEQIYKIQLELGEKLNISVSFAIGNIYEKLTDMGYSFSQAKQALEFINMERDRKIAFYEEIPINNKDFYYPLDVESRLVNLVKAGEKLETERLLRSIFSENFISRQLSTDMVHGLLYEICGTLVKVRGSSIKGSSMKRIMSKIEYVESIDELCNMIIQEYYMVCDNITEQKGVIDQKMKKEISDYIEACYINDSLTLCDIATKFKLSESYLYQCFKEWFNMTFSDYLEGYRIHKACDLLLASNLSIEDIAANIGYASCRTFRRAFKRYTGVSPSEFRHEKRETTGNVL